MKKMCEIREYILNDLEAVTTAFNVVVAAGNAFMTEHPVSTQQMQNRLENEEKVFLAVNKQSVVGCYMLRPNMKGRGDHIANATYFVAEGQRGKGIGSLLAQHSISTAKNLGYRAMQYNGVVIGNETSLHFWKKIGFEVVGKIPGGFRNKQDGYDDVCIMYKKI
jgi:L-amino acid N-acyltransferase YncA